MAKIHHRDELIHDPLASRLAKSVVVVGRYIMLDSVDPYD